MRASKILIRSVFAIVVTAGLVMAIPTSASADTAGQEVNLSTLRCLDSNAAASVYTLGCNGGNFQKWHAHWDSFGYNLINVQTGRCLDDDVAAGDVRANNCNGGSYQEWTGFPSNNPTTRVRGPM